MRTAYFFFALVVYSFTFIIKLHTLKVYKTNNLFAHAWIFIRIQQVGIGVTPKLLYAYLKHLFGMDVWYDDNARY
jgi:hypothetical protein